MNNRFKATLVQPHIPQTHATQLDGTKGKGLLIASRPLWSVGIWAKADASLDWAVEIEMPNPEAGGTPIVYPWLSVTGTSLIDCLNMALPVGSKILVKTSAGSNPTVQFVTELEKRV